MIKLRVWALSKYAHRCLLTVYVTIWACSIAPLMAAQAPRDYQVQAAMLFKFLTYIEWPAYTFPEADAPYRITVLGDRRIEDELKRITAQRKVNGRPIEVESVGRISDIDRPHLLFVGSGVEKYLPRLARLARKRSFLIVTENQSELKEGSTINLRLINDRIGFDVSLPRAEDADVKLSARLLSVAASVERAER